MSESVRTTCPKCQTSLRIPAGWADNAVKCKKCGAVIPGRKADTIPTAKRVKPVAKPAPPVEPREANPPLLPTARLLPPPPPPAQVVPDSSLTVPVAEPIQVVTPTAYQKSGAVFSPQQSAPEYQPPSYPEPTGVYPMPGMDGFAPEPVIGAANRHRRGSGGGKFVWIGFALLMTGGLVAGAIVFKDDIARLRGKPPDVVTAPTKKAITPVRPTVAAAFPRRMLVLSVSKYLFCNGLSAGSPTQPENGDHATEAAKRLAFDWRVPTGKDNNQLHVVSDTTAKDARPMLKPVIQQSYERFFETSRPQDHVVVYFGGHAVEKDGKAYLVPVDGDLTDPSTLIPLDDFYAKLKACPAHQKAVLFDVCRLNEADDQVRPGGEPMTPALEKALLAAPDGVQVALSCSADQRALEYRTAPSDAPDVAGSLFLSALKYAAMKGKVKGAKDQKPEDPIPVAAWVEAAKARMAEVAKLTGKPEPTPKLAGTDPGPVEVKADDAPAKPFVVPAAPKGLSPADVKKVFAVAELPALRPSEAANEEPVETVIPFTAEAMAPYSPDSVPEAEIMKEKDKYPVRAAALDALQFLRKEWGATAGDDKSGSKLRDRFDGDTDAAVKKLIRGEQEAPARIILELEEKTRLMDALVPKLAEEPSKYWRVTFQYALAEVKTRLAYMHEYDNALAAIVTDTLPERDPKKHSGLQLVSSDKMKSKKDVKDVAEAGRELFTKIAEENKGTPWAVQARRAKVVGLGLTWQPLPKPTMTRDE